MSPRLNISFLISLLAHTFIIVIFSLSQKNFIEKKHTNVEVYYQAEEKFIKSNEIPRNLNDFKIAEGEKISKKFKPVSKGEMPDYDPTHDIKDISKFANTEEFGDFNHAKVQTLDLSKKISVPMMQTDKNLDPVFLSYDQGLRQRILLRIDQLVKYVDIEAGEVFVSFSLNNNGEIQDIQIIDEKSTANDFFRRMVVRCVREVSPFEVPPEHWKSDKLRFNVVVAFKEN